MEDPEKKPKRARKKRRSPTKKKPKLPVESVDDKTVPPLPPPISEGSAFASLSSLNLVAMLGESPATKKRRASTEAVGSQLQEHLSSFILIGYTLDGKPVNMTYASTPQEYDSLSTGLQRYIMSTGDGGF
jgi:hypothetical protein